MNRTKLQRTPRVFGTSYRPTSNQTRKAGPTLSTKHWRPILIVVGVIVAGFLVTRLPIFQIKSVAISGITNQELLKELESLKGTSIFSSQINRVTTKWLSRDPSLAQLQCSRGLPDTVRCMGMVRSGALIWKRADTEYWVDNDGRAFALRLPTDPVGLVVEDRVGEVAAGVDVASGEIVEAYSQLQKKLAERTITIKELIVVDALYLPSVIITSFPGPAGSTIQKEITAQFVLTESVDAQVQILASLLSQRGNAIADRIDLRVPEYVYYH